MDGHEEGGISRRGFIRAGAGLAAGLWLTGCGPRQEDRREQSSGSSTQGAAPARASDAFGPVSGARAGGTFRIGVHVDVVNFDPHLGGSGGYLQQMGLVYNGLARWANEPDLDEAKLVPELAERWDHPDPVTWIFHLRKGVRFHNLPPVSGREMDAEDVKYSIERFNDSEDPRFRLRGFFGKILRMETPDRYTLKIIHSEPYGPFLINVGYPYHGVVPKEVVDKESDKIIRTPIGTGAFVQSEYTPKVGGVYVRNPDFFVKGLPYLDRVEVQIVPDHEARLNAFRGKQVDEPGYFLTPARVDAIEKSLGSEAVVAKAPRFIPSGVRFNMVQPPFNDIRLRKAVHLAINRQALAKVEFQGEAFPYRFFPWGWTNWATPMEQVLKMPGYRPDKTQDLAEARRLVQEAGAAGMTFRAMVNRSGEDVAEATAIKDQLREIGLNMEIEIVEQAVATTRETKGDFVLEVTSGGGGAVDVDPDNRLWELYYPGQQVYVKYSTPQVEAEMRRLIEGQRQETDRARRRELLSKILDIMEAEVTNAPTIAGYAYRSWPARFKGLAAEPKYGSHVRWFDHVYET